MELMMILLVASLIIAAIAPVVTKKHFRLPSLVNHGAYMCYYENGQLREAKWAGKFQQQELFNRATDNCVFTPPKKAAYFQVSAIGGGGGGGDAGYTGGNWTSTSGEYTKVTPFGITVDGLTTLLDLEDIPESERGPFIEEWKLYAGELIGYANSVGSGAGGDIGLINAPTEEKRCAEYKVETTYEYNCTEWEGPHESTSTSTSEDGTITCHWKDCDDIRSCETCYRDATRTWTTGGECTKYGPDIEKDCSTTYTTQENCRPGPPKPCFSNCTGTGMTPGASAGADHGGGCPQIPSTCPSDEQVCDTVTHKIEKTCTEPGPCIERAPTETHSETYKESYACNCTTNTVCNEGSFTVESADDCQSGVRNCKTKEEIPINTVTDECIVWAESLWHWSNSSASGAPGGSGASCQSSGRVKGGLEVTESGSDTINTGAPKDGEDLDVGVSAENCLPAAYAYDGYAVCSGGSLSTSCASPSYSYYKITNPAVGSVEVKAESATRGGGGAGRTTATDANGHCYNVSTSPKHTATNGQCAIGSSQSDCRGSGKFGYCLAHHYALSTPEPGGLYEFRYGYDQNYLGYGGAGSPGQFKTTIVRSLSDVDLTIKIGRGGSAAAYNSGLKGAKGSATSMGEIIVANGGEGGSGKLKQAAETLPTYNKDRHDKESLCYFYTKYTEKNPDDTYRDNSPEAQELRNKLTTEPGYCAGMINNIGEYKFFKVAGNVTGDYPTPTGVFSTFMNVAFSSSSSSDLFNRFIKFGRGGTGGGVEHRCWAGRHDVVFEGEILSSSVFVDKDSASDYAIAHNKYVPEGCRNDYKNIPASPGADGALLIKW